jgi:hypothetical protein
MASVAPTWNRDARCADADPEAFYVAAGGDALPAKRVCWPCPVRKVCLVAGIDERFGVWGGLTERDRALVREGKRGGRWLINWQAAEQLADPDRLVEERRNAHVRLVAEYEAGVPITKLARRHRMTSEAVAEVLVDAGYRQTTGDELAPVCTAGHAITGDNRVRNGHTPSGRPRYACRRCMRARMRGVCVSCAAPAPRVVCASCQEAS